MGDIEAGKSLSSIYKFGSNELVGLIESKSPDRLVEMGGVQAIAAGLQTDLKHGLSRAEMDANFVDRIAAFGENRSPPPPYKNIFQLFYGALQDLTIIILAAAAVVSIILGVTVPEHKGGEKTGWIEGAAILMAVWIVASVTAINDYQKEKQFRSLNDVKNNRTVKVMRDGEEIPISIFDIVVGDVVNLDTGDQVPADGIYVEGHDLTVDESVMTGESDAVKKGHQSPLMLSGTQVQEGIGKMLVIAIGEHSEWGKAMKKLQAPNPDTPLQEQLDDMAKFIGKFGLAVAVLVFLVLTIYWIIRVHDDFQGSDMKELVDFFIIAVTIIVVAIPEGLPLAVTISLAYSMKQMMKDNNLVRHLEACETMGGATNICSDKTGTLTENRMTVLQGWAAGKEFKEVPLEYTLDPKVHAILNEGIAINSNANLVNEPGKPTTFVGNKTECALLGFTKELNVDYKKIREAVPRYKLYTFSSARKCMSSIIALDNGRFRIYTKGAAEIVLRKCNGVMAPDGTVHAMEDKERMYLEALILGMATLGLRTICMAFRDFDQDGGSAWDADPPDTDLACISIVGIKDPLRKEVPGAVRQCQAAGIFVRMVTGDNIETAKRIAEDCGILMPGGLALEGPVFAKMSPEEIDAILPRLQVLARSSPTDKHTLVHRLRENDEVVAVTGDGTNDAPALKEADVGLSMGISGTEVAKEASDIVILDDNFKSIVLSVMWGRSVYDNIRKFLQFQLTVNGVALTIAFIGALTDKGSPFRAIQLLWVNLIMDTMAALALATEKPTLDLLNRMPYGRLDNLISNRMWRNIVGHSVFQCIILLFILYAGAYVWDVKDGSVHHYTILFNTFVFLQIFNEINSRKVNDELNIFSGITTSTIFMVVMVITIIVQAIIIEFGDRAFETTGLRWHEWLACLAFGVAGLPFGLILRFLPMPPPPSALRPNPNEAFMRSETHKDKGKSLSSSVDDGAGPSATVVDI